MTVIQKKTVSILLGGLFLLFAAGPALAADPAPKPAPAPAAAPAPAPAAAPKPAAPAAPPAVLKVGDTLPGIATMDMEGKPVELGSLIKANALNVIAFTNSACYACGTEATLLSSLKGKHKDKINLIGVVVDISPNAYLTTAEDVRKNFSFVHDKRFKMTQQFGFDSTPATALIKGGKVVELKSGFKPEDSEAFAEAIEKRM